jgi:hypothetical protein
VGLGSKTNMLDATAGATIASTGEGNKPQAVAIPTFSLGYRYKHQPQGFLFRIGATGFVTPHGVLPIIPWPYLSLGGTFR